MFEVRDTLKTVLEAIDGVTVITSSWRAARKQFPLPAIIVDWDATTPIETTEAGDVLAKQYSFPVTAVVSLTNVNDDDAMRSLEALVDSITSALDADIGKNNYTVQNWFPINIPWGKVEALAGSFQLLITL